jgi:4-hydroxythreonine-4-phosphate dehydrogenase
VIDRANIVILGEHQLYRMGEAVVGPLLDLPVLASIDEVDPDQDGPALVNYPNIGLSDFKPGQVDIAAGRYVLQSLTFALQLAQEGKIDAICFPPLNKQAMHLAGNPFHDEMRFFVHHLGVKGPFGELNALDNLWFSRVTSHVPISEVSQHITRDNVFKIIGLTHQTLRRAGFDHPRIAVAALNPHAGDGGVCGREEIDQIEPAIALARAGGFDITGPIPADVVFPQARTGAYDAVVTMYHDQGQIAMKMMDLDRGATVHGGLPVITTTTMHGTAFDIVGQGKAKIDSLRSAFFLACQMAEANLT